MRVPDKPLSKQERYRDRVQNGQSTSMQHGTTAMYTAGGCRCRACKTAMRDYQRARRAQKRMEGR